MAEVDKRPEAEFDSYSKNYDALVNSSIAFSGLKVDFFTRAKAGYLVEIITDCFADPGSVRVLDVGCGVGNYHGYLSPRFGTVAGVDVSAQSIETARSRNRDVSYEVYDGERLPYPDESFDVAFTICVMHHVPPQQWDEFGREMSRVLKPGGLALVFEHNPLNPLTRHVVSSCEFDANAVLLRAPTTESILKKAGLDGVESQFILTVPAAGRNIRWMDKLFSRVPLGAQYITRGQKR